MRTKTTEVNWQHTREIGRERTLLREEFELGAALGVQQTLFATAQVQTGEIAGGEGKVSLTGVIDLCVYHAGSEKPLLVTRHAMPFETTVKASGDLSQDAVLEAQVTLRDVLADSMGTGDGERVLRVEVEIEAAIFAHETQQTTLLQDAYTLSGDALSLTREEVSVSSSGVNTCAKDSGKMMLTLPEEHPPVGTVLAAFATPVVGAQEKAGTQLRVDGVLGITVIYLPMDSGIPVSAVFSQPFTAGFETNADVGEAQLCCTEIVATGITSDRIEARYALQLCARSAGTQSLNIITQVQEVPAPEQSGGICVYFPGEEESLWDVARRYRVDETALAHLNAGREAVQPIVVLRRRHV